MTYLTLKLIDYRGLDANQQEVYNFQKVAVGLADYGFNCTKLDDDWPGAGFLPCHNDGTQTFGVQLKGRLKIDMKYEEKNLYICFPDRDVCSVRHDTTAPVLPIHGILAGQTATIIRPALEE